MKLIITKKGLAQSLVLKVRVFRTRKWLIGSISQRDSLNMKATG